MRNDPHAFRIPSSAFRVNLMRWIWIDRFVSFESGKAAVATKNLSLAEDYFADHVPGYPVMPAPLVVRSSTGPVNPRLNPQLNPQ